MDSCVIFRSNYFSSCIQLLELLASVGSNMLFGICSFNNYLHILFGNPKEAYKPPSPCHGFGSQQANCVRTEHEILQDSVSLGCWLPGILAYSIRSLCFSCVPLPLLHVCTTLHLVNSLVNPIIYCFRIPMFRETLKRMKVRKHSKQYKVNYSL